MFVQATKQKLRFVAPKGGSLTVEDLWDLPLQSKDGNSLELLAESHDKQASKRSYIPGSKVIDKVAQLKFDIIMFIIDFKVELAEKAKRKAANRIEREKLLAALAAQDDNDIKGLPREELMKRLESLSED